MTTTKPATRPGPPAIVYLTKNDYFNLVPVIMNAEKTAIVSFADPKDLKRGNAFTLPVKLAGGYLLDNRGINQNVAFLDITYQAYGELAKVPSSDELMKMVLDDDPLIEMYDCGLKSDFKELEAELNQYISEGKLHEFKKLK